MTKKERNALIGKIREMLEDDKDWYDEDVQESLEPLRKEKAREGIVELSLEEIEGIGEIFGMKGNDQVFSDEKYFPFHAGAALKDQIDGTNLFEYDVEEDEDFYSEDLEDPEKFWKNFAPYGESFPIGWSGTSGDGEDEDEVEE